MTEAKESLNSDPKSIGSWHGRGLKGERLNQFIHQTSSRIDILWEKEYQNHSEELLVVDSYRRVADQLGYFATNVREACSLLIESGDSAKIEVGKKVLLHTFLNTILASVDRLEGYYPGILQKEQMLEEGLLTVMQEINKLDILKKGVTARVNTEVFTRGQSMIADIFGVQVTQVTEGHCPLENRRELVESDVSESLLTRAYDMETILTAVDPQEVAENSELNMTYAIKPPIC